MKFKQKLLSFQKALVTGRLSEQQPQLALALGWALDFLLGFVLSAAPVGGRGGPFGIAITAVIGGSLGGLFTALGASLSYLALLGLDKGLRYVATVFLTFTASYVFQELTVYRSRWFMPAIAALFTLLTGLLSSFLVLDGDRLIAPVLLQSVLTFAGAYFFREAISRGERSTESAELRHSVSLLLLLACLLMALSGAEIAGSVSLGRVFAMLLVLVVAYKCGTVTGAAAGLVLGLAMDAASPEAPFYAMAYGASALLSGVFSRRGRFLYVLIFAAACALSVAAISFNGYRTAALYETALSCGCFLLLPNRALSFLGAAVRPAQYDSGETGLRRYAARRVASMAEAFRDLYQTLDASLGCGEGPEDISRIYDRASELVCAKCSRKNICWNANYMDTLSVFNDTAEVIRSRGQLLASDVAAHFTEQCLHIEALVGAVNGELRGQMYRRRFLDRIRENRSAAFSQYADLSEILCGVSEELQNACGPDPLAQRRLLRFLNSMDVEADASVFRDRCGRLHIVLESARLQQLLRTPGYLDRLSAAIGVRLCRPGGAEQGGEGRVTLLEAEPLSVSVGIASLKKKGESVSGDRGTYFKTDQGILCILLSDGMGSGESAARESTAAVRILERFLRAGVDPAVAMRILNSVLLLKNETEWGFATVDLMCIDLFTGETAFYKYGAAPSYVRCGRTVRRVRSENLAAGLMPGDKCAPDIVRLRMKPGNVALIASDGVIAETKDDWIRALLADHAAADTKELARETLKTALTQYGCSDDMTVLAVRMDSRA